MARRPEQRRPKTFETKRFTQEEIDRGIARLQRRIDEIQALARDRLRYNDQRVDTARLGMVEAIRETFGDASAEYDAYRYVRIWKGPMMVGDPPEEIQRKFEAGVPNAVELLRGLIRRLEERRAELDHDRDRRTAAALADMNLHPVIDAAVSRLFEDGHYANAVLDGAIALTNHVKGKSGRHDLDGAQLMHTVFSANRPVLAFNELQDQTDRDEQEGMMHLFVGAVLGIRNPRSHEVFDHDPQRAAEYIMLLSLLAKRVDEARRATP